MQMIPSDKFWELYSKYKKLLIILGTIARLPDPPAGTPDEYNYKLIAQKALDGEA